MEIDSAEMVGLIAGFVGAFAFAPQAIKIIRDGDGSNVSTLTYAMVFSGAVLWGVYGLMRGAPSVILWNVVAASLAALVLLLKLRPKRPSA